MSGPVISTPTALPLVRFQVVKSHVRESYLRSVEAIKGLKASKGAPQVTARQKAHRRGLSLDTVLACACPQNQVSVVPLPVVIQDLITDQSFNGVPIIKAPVPRRPHETTGAVVPVVKAPQRPSAPRPLPVIPTPQSHRASPMDVPMDAENHFDLVTLSPMDESDSSQDSSSSGASSSASSSSGVLTPEEAYTPVVLRVKRRSTASADIDYTFEKRPRYERNDRLAPHHYQVATIGHAF